MHISISFRRFVEQWGGVRPRRHRAGQRRSERRILPSPLAAIVDVLETRELLSSIVVNSAAGGQNYASTVTASQLDPAHTAVTLRDAVNAANNSTGADTISFDASVFSPNAPSGTTIVLSGGIPLQLTDTTGATTIDGPGAAQVAVSGNNLSTVFVIKVGVTVAIDGLTITAGQGSIDVGGGLKAGGGLYNNGRLTLTDTVITGNAAGNQGGGFYNSTTGSVSVLTSTITGNTGQLGGGFLNSGTATITNSTIAGNTVTGNGGGFYSIGTVTLSGSTLANNSAGASGGGFFSNNTVTLINSTLTGNAAASSGGGFINLKTANVLDSTIAGNFAASGAGIYNSVGTVTLSGTILARNAVSATNSTPRDWGGLAASAASSYSLIGDGTGTGLTNGTNHNLVGTSASPLNPLLAPLGDYGGPTQSMALLPGSLALAAGSTFNVPAGGVIVTDQRGVARSVGILPDIGAYQSAGFALIGTDGDNQSTIINQSFSQALTVQLIEKAFSKPLKGAGVVVNFSAPQTSSSAALSAGSIGTDANGRAGVTAQANGTIGGPYAVLASAAGIDPATFHLTNLEAPSLVVSTTQDVVNNLDGLTSLREAIAYAGTFTTPATISFDPSVFPAGSLTTITLGGSALELTNTAAPITIAGPGAGQLAISANGLSAVFVVNAQVHAEIDGLTITGGKGTSGGGIYNAGTLALGNDTLSGNSADNGGGFYNAGSITVAASTLSGNIAGSGGGFYNAGSAWLTNSTLAGNSASDGGGVCNQGGTVTLAAATVAANIAQFGGGVDNQLGNVLLSSTILALNTQGPTNVTPADWFGTAADAASTNNLVGDGTNTGFTAGVNGNLVGDAANPIDPGLAPLADNGGPTETMALLTGSLAINAGNTALLSGLSTDQRATGFNRIAGAASDIGAFEIQSHPPALPTADSLTTTDPLPTLTGTWDSANAVTLQVTISNSSAGFSATYTLGQNPELVASGGTWTLNLAGAAPLAVGAYSVQVHTVNDIGESAGSSPGSLLVNSTPPVLGPLDALSANVGDVVSFSVEITAGDTTGLVAAIDWGDETTGLGTIALVDGVLTVSGSHSYSAAGTFNVQLTVTNASGLSAAASTTATIASVATSADLKVIAGQNVQIVAMTATASYDFDVLFVSGGVQLIGKQGTTFNGVSTLFLANAKSISGQLGDGDDRVRIVGSGKNVTLDMGGGHNHLTLRQFEGQMLQVTSAGALNMHVWNSQLSNLLVTGSATADNRFRAFGLAVSTETKLSLGSGANRVRIDDSSFKNFKLESTGIGTVVRIEAGLRDGIGTRFDGTVQFVVGGGSRLIFSPVAKSDLTVFNGTLIINSGQPDTIWIRQNVRFARRPVLNNVTVV